MPRRPTGNVYESRGRWYARVTLDKGERPSIPLATCADVKAAEKRGAVLADLAAQLRAAGVPLDVRRKLVERAGEAAEGKALAKVKNAATDICSGAARPMVDPSSPVTVQALGERWTSGELARAYPDHVRVKKSAQDDVERFESYVYPIAGGVPLDAFTVDHADAVMRALPARLAPATRRGVAVLLHRLLAMAVFPLRLIPANPLPRGFLPKMSAPKAKGWIYPDEDRRLLACLDVPLCWRILYGFLDREGMRLSEAVRLDVSDVDLTRGAVTLDTNKTDDPRAWAMSPGATRALAAWIALREKAAGAPLPRSAPLFVDEAGERLREATARARRFRDHLRAAGVDRPELFEQTAERMQVRLHDLRASFVTIALANGRSEAWVADRTGHKSSVMINRYRRAARTAAELGLGDMLPLDVAVPELGRHGDGKGGGKGGGGSEQGDGSAKNTTKQAFGGVAERSKAAVLKTADGQPSRGSNPFSSAEIS